MFWVNGVYVDSDGAAVDPQPELPVPGITDAEILALQASDQLTAALAKIAALEERNTYLEAALAPKPESRAAKVSAAEGK